MFVSASSTAKTTARHSASGKPSICASCSRAFLTTQSVSGLLGNSILRSKLRRFTPATLQTPRVANYCAGGFPLTGAPSPLSRQYSTNSRPSRERGYLMTAAPTKTQAELGLMGHTLFETAHSACFEQTIFPDRQEGKRPTLRRA